MANIYHRMLRDGTEDGIASLQGDTLPPFEEPVSGQKADTPKIKKTICQRLWSTSFS
jgi:ABC-type xylose transport system substrate-binding protein